VPIYERVVDEYPDSPYAKIAALELQQIARRSREEGD